MASDEIDPWGPEREDRRMAVLVQAVYRSARIPVDMAEAIALVNPWRNESPAKPDPGELRRKIARFNAMVCNMGGVR